jgi:prepilin-type N-terminal cleavage/methylation domain-containing protein
MKQWKKKAFTLLEVLFAIVIISIATSSIFLFIKHVMKTTTRITKKTQEAESMTIIFSPYFQAIDETDEKKENKTYEKTPFNIEKVKHIVMLSTQEKNQPKIFNGLLYLAPQKDDEKNEKI